MKRLTMKSILACAAALAIAAPLSTQATGLIFDDFNVNEGHFNLQPTFSGSTVGVLTSSTADRVTTNPKEGSGCEKLILNTNGLPSIRVRFLSGSGTPANNTAFTTSAATDGWIGCYVKTTNTGWTVQIWLEGASQNGSNQKQLTNDGEWHLYEWDLDNTAGDADGWGSVQGIIDGVATVADGSHTIDSILFRNTNSTVSVNEIFLDFLAKNDSGSVAELLVDPCHNTSGIIVNGPISTNSNEVAVAGVDGAATKITVYQDSGAGMVEIGSKTSGITAGNNTVTVSGLIKTAIVAATQTVAGQESCVPTTGAMVGGGTSTRVRVTLSIKETTSTGPIGASADDISSSNMHHLGATNVLSGYAPGSGVVLSPSTSWQTITLGGKQGIGDPASVAGGLTDASVLGGYGAGSTVKLRVYAFKAVPPLNITAYSATPAETSTAVTSNDTFVVNWSWTGVTGVDGYRIVRSTDDGGTWGSYVDIAGAGNTTYSDANTGDWLGGTGPDGSVVVTPTKAQTDHSIQWYLTPNTNPDNIPGEWGILESIAFAIDDLTDTGPYDLYIDNLKNGDTVFQDFEGATAGQTDYGFRAPSYSGTTSGGLLMPPNIGEVSSAAADTGTKSFHVQWQWKGTNATSWLRFTTHATLTSPIPGCNPMVDLNQPISIRFLLLPVGALPVPPLSSVTISNITATTITYGGGGGSQFVLLESDDVSAALSGWTRAQTNAATPGSFTITPSAAKKFYSIRSE